MKLLTPPGTAGVAVVRAAAAEREALLASLFTTRGEPLHVVAGAAPKRADLRLGGQVLDDVLVVDRGERGLEVHLHAAPAVLAALRRAFAFVDRGDPSAAGQLLSAAWSVEQVDLALEQLAGDFEQFVHELEGLPAAERRATLAATIVRSQVARAMLEPLRLVLVGGQNAGKSSLFNLILARERVLTGPVPGLTRDPVSEGTTLAGYPYEIVDTAGEGPVASGLDALAIEVGRAQRPLGHLLLVIDAAVGPTPGDLAMAAAGATVIANKSDLPPAGWPSDLACALRISCATSSACAVRVALGEVLRMQRGLPPAGRVGGVAAMTAAQREMLQRRHDLIR